MLPDSKVIITIVTCETRSNLSKLHTEKNIQQQENSFPVPQSLACAHRQMLIGFMNEEV